MTYFETVMIYRGMPSGLDQRDPINLCFGLEKALAELLIFPFCVGSEESLFFSPVFFLLVFRPETSGGVFGESTAWALLFQYCSVLSTFLLGGIYIMEQQSPPLFVSA